MGSDNWFRHFEALLTEHPELDDDKLSEMATEAERDEYADRADQIYDERWIRNKLNET